MYVGDLATGREYLDAGIRQSREYLDAGHNRDVAVWKNLSIGLQNLTDCLCRLGYTQPAVRAAAEAVTYATTIDDRTEMRDAAAYLGWAADLAGDTAAAEQQFLAGGRIGYHHDKDHDHLYSLPGVCWGSFLARTGRPGPARRLTTSNLAISQDQGWGANVARCCELLARLELLDHDLDSAGDHLAAALRTFRDGDYLVELAETLTVAADHARRTGHLDAAVDHVAEALEIAAPRGLTPIHAAALTMRAYIAADQHTSTHDSQHLYVGRDAADAALRLATGAHPLPWQELDALQAHAHIDKTEGTKHGWNTRATQLHHRLVPDGLDPDPLTTIENETDTDAEDAIRGYEVNGGSDLDNMSRR